MAKAKPLFSFPDMAGKLHVRRGDTGEHERWADALMPADAQAGPIETETNRRPIVFLGSIVMGAVVVLVLQLFRLQILSGNRNLGLADGNRINQTITRAPRGGIYDRNHQPLVQNVASFDVTVTPELVPKSAAERQRIFARVSEITGVSVVEIEQKLAKNSKLNPLQPQLVVAGLDRPKGLLFDQESLSLTGFSLDINPIRSYMTGPLLSDVVGYTGRVSQTDLKSHTKYLPTDYVGKAGIEAQYDELLRGVNGSEQTEVDAMRRPVKVLASTEAQPGSSLTLTIDKGLQTKLTETLTAQMTRAGVSKASGVALNPNTGEVLALVTLPSYDSNQFAHGIKQADYAKLTSNPAQPLFNKATSGGYPVGSIIKPLISLAALHEGTVTPNTTVTDKGFIQLPNPYDPSVVYTYRSWEPGGLGPVNMVRAIAMSSDIYFYSVGGGFEHVKGLGVKRLTDWYQRFGLGKKTGIDLPGESAGRVPTPDWKQKTFKQPWYVGDTFNISVGQGDLLASPLQMAVALASIVNGGNVMKPFLLKEVTTNTAQKVKATEPAVVAKLPLDPAHIQVVREGMRQVVTNGTAGSSFQPAIPVPVAGKTGTAETDPEGGRKPQSWFTAFAPYDNPQIVIVALIENAGEGSVFAAPAVRDTLAWYFSPH